MTGFRQVSAKDEHMNPRTTRLLLILSAFLAGLVLCFAVVLLVTGRGAAPIARRAAIGGPFRLTDQNGKSDHRPGPQGPAVPGVLRLHPLPGSLPDRAVRNFGDHRTSSAPDAEKVNALFVTVDPERDTPAVLKDYLSSFNPRLIGVGGDADALAAVAKAYRVYYKKVPLKDGDYTMDHTAHRLSDGQERAVRRAVQPQAAARGRGRRAAPLSLSTIVRAVPVCAARREVRASPCAVFSQRYGSRTSCKSARHAATESSSQCTGISSSTQAWRSSRGA